MKKVSASAPKWLMKHPRLKGVDGENICVYSEKWHLTSLLIIVERIEQQIFMFSDRKNSLFDLKINYKKIKYNRNKSKIYIKKKKLEMMKMRWDLRSDHHSSSPNRLSLILAGFSFVRRFHAYFFMILTHHESFDLTCLFCKIYESTLCWIRGVLIWDIFKCLYFYTINNLSLTNLYFKSTILHSLMKLWNVKEYCW